VIKGIMAYLRAHPCRLCSVCGLAVIDGWMAPPAPASHGCQHARWILIPVSGFERFTTAVYMLSIRLVRCCIHCSTQLFFVMNFAWDEFIFD
jgi:hypothetical protein